MKTRTPCVEVTAWCATGSGGRPVAVSTFHMSPLEMQKSRPLRPFIHWLCTGDDPSALTRASSLVMSSVFCSNSSWLTYDTLVLYNTTVYEQYNIYMT